MILLNNKLNENEIRIGEIYPKELINFYCKEYDCALIKLNSSNSTESDKKKYMVKQIINNVDMDVNKNFNSYSAYNKKLIIIERA
ncbi:MAG: hypothetical protein E6929_03065 [Clostridium sp.]|nr:hypothetical protein [Clostridium sp.]